MTTTSPPTPPNPTQRLIGALATALVLMLAYASNGDFLPSSDAVGNTYLPISVLRDGDMLFHPKDEPFMFKWELREGATVRQVELRALSETVAGVVASRRVEEGTLVVKEPFYYVVKRPADDSYANTFGPGAGLAALPVFALARVALGEELFTRHDWIWHLSKLAAALMVALSGAAVFLTASRFASMSVSAATAAIYGLGTCVWSTSSQILWQHGPNALFLAAGVACLAWALKRDTAEEAGNAPLGYAIGAGVALGCAVACRPTSLLVVAVVAVFLVLRQRREGFAFVGGAIVPGAALAAHNALMYGSPLSFGQTMASVAMAEEKTGVASVWALAFHESVPGLLLSPSRGVLIYSPIVAVALAGLVMAWRRQDAEGDEVWTLLKPLGVAALSLWLVAFAWYDWWGGWAFGYRPLVDTMPLICVGLVPMLSLVAADRSKRALVAGLAALSIGVQLLGAFSYSTLDWNNRPIYEVRSPGESEPRLVVEREELESLKATGGQVVRQGHMNIDKPHNRHRLWSLSDSQLVYYIQNPVEGRQSKANFQRVWVGLFAPRGPSR